MIYFSLLRFPKEGKDANSEKEENMRRILALLIISALLFGCGGPKTVTRDSENEKTQLETQNREYCAEINTLISLIGYLYKETGPTQEDLQEDVFPLAINLVKPASQVKPGRIAELRITTQPGAICFIAICYESGLSEATGITEHSPQEVDQNGECSWQWKVGGNTKPGEWPIVVTAYLDGETYTLKTSIKVE